MTTTDTTAPTPPAPPDDDRCFVLLYPAWFPGDHHGTAQAVNLIELSRAFRAEAHSDVDRPVGILWIDDQGRPRPVRARSTVGPSDDDYLTVTVRLVDEATDRPVGRFTYSVDGRN